MTDDNSNKNLVDIDTDDLDAFEKVFFDKEDAVEEVAEEVDDEDDSLANEEDIDASAETEDDEDEDEVEELEEEPKPQKKNRKSAKERIDELVADKRQTERDLAALRAEFDQLRSRETKTKEETKVDIRDHLPEDAPKPDAENDKGEPLYPLGEYDPLYIKDLTRFTIEQEMKAADKIKEEKAQQEQFQEVQNQLQSQWLENLDKAEEELPDIRENIRDLTETFQDLPPQYGEYLASVLMASEFGPQIMYYLSQNIGEAQRIVASGPAAATRALGRLEAKFDISSKPGEQKQHKKVSEAPEPPEGRTRGHGGRFATAPDTDDQEAFEREFFKK